MSFSRTLSKVILVSGLFAFAGCPSNTKDQTAPSITTQPADSFVGEGSPASFQVVVPGGSLTYRWSRNGTVIAGATSASYTTNATVLADSSSTFSVVISNAAGSVTSRTAALTVSPPGSGISATLTVDTLDRHGVQATHFFAYQDGDSPWQSHAAQAPGHHEIAIFNPAGRYAIAYGDGESDAAPDPGYTLNTVTPVPFAGAMAYGTIAELPHVTLPLGRAVTTREPIHETATITAGSEDVDMFFLGGTGDGPTLASDTFMAQTDYNHRVGMRQGVQYTACARTKPVAAGELPVILCHTQTFVTLPVPEGSTEATRDWGTFDFTAGVPINGWVSNKTLAITGAPANASVETTFSFALPQDDYLIPIGSMTSASSNATASAAGAATTPLLVANVHSLGAEPLNVIDVSTVFPSGAEAYATRYYATPDDFSVQLPPELVGQPVTIPTTTPYLRPVQGFTTLPATNAVYVLEVNYLKKGWTVFGTNGWFGGASKAASWQFPDLSAVPGWKNDFATAGAVTDVTVGLRGISCGSVQSSFANALRERMVYVAVAGATVLPQAGESCSSSVSAYTAANDL